MTETNETAVQAAVDAELRLLDGAVRASREQVLELLDPEFTEIGASGRWWDRDSILEVTSSGSVSEESPVVVSEMSGVVLAPGLVHLTYFSDHDGRLARRSSLWRLSGTGWRLYFHQGTLVP
ncbi:nuclear transport factor 2 family protein [Streptomyces similanensis]|uniref:Nuclear transport factor 2 family protein n=1 Tax=Streptomyces similanensis TaxID=1274988 RepID=A0ABP9L2N4_9ACTN|nr:nuclear transport factor 2 family protein [Streptomyces seoulensis]